LKFISVDDYILRAMNLLYRYPPHSGLHEAHSQFNFIDKIHPGAGRGRFWECVT